MFNLTGRKRETEIAVQLRLLAIAERALLHRMRAAINRASKSAVQAYQSRGSLDYALRDHAPEVERLLTVAYRSTAIRFGGRVFSVLAVAKSSANQNLHRGKRRLALETKDTADAFDASVASWIGKYTAQKVTAISGTTRKQIIDAISEGESQGIGVDATARLIREKTGGAVASLRAAIIARTETHAAATFGGDAAVDALGLQQVTREWMAVDDPRTRPSHKAADGQRVGMNEPFRVGGATLDRPGDPSAPPEESINCRCVLGYITPGFE